MHRSRILPKFNEYRQQGLFVDLFYITDHHQYSGHKLILAQKSTFFHNVFNASNDRSIFITVPFNPDSKFQYFIDFIYTGQLQIDAKATNIVLDLFMIGVFYGVQILVDLVQDVLIKRLPELDPTSLFHFLAQFKEPMIRDQSDVVPEEASGPNQEELSNWIQQGLAALKKSQLLFVRTIISRFNVFLAEKKDELLSSITPWLLIKVLTKMDNPLPTSELVELIEAFVQKLPKHLLTEDDRSEFNSLIDWNDEKIYPFFLKYDLEWVYPSTARKCLAILHGKRCNIIQALEGRTVDLPSENSISPWFVWSWFQAINDCAETAEQPEVELIEFIGTFGKAGVPCNPITLGFIENYSTPSIGARAQREKGVGAQILFDASLTAQEREGWHYTSQPTEKPYIGFKLHGFMFYPTIVIFDFHAPEGTVYKGPQNLRLEIGNEKKVSTQAAEVDFDGSAIIQVRNPIPLSTLKIEMVGNKNNNILRASSLKVHGFFLPVSSFGGSESV